MTQITASVSVPTGSRDVRIVLQAPLTVTQETVWVNISKVSGGGSVLYTTNRGSSTAAPAISAGRPAPTYMDIEAGGYLPPGSASLYVALRIEGELIDFPDPPPTTPPDLSLNTRLKTNRGARTPITGSELHAVDDESTATNVTYLLTALPRHGTLFLDGKPLQPWFEHNENWYRRTSLPENWFAAEAEALSAGGHLVTLSNDDENSWVASTFRRAWSGLTDEGHDYTFVYSSGEPVGFLNFAPNEPNGGWNEGCVEVTSNGKLNDLNCHVQLYGVIEVQTSARAAHKVTQSAIV